MGCSMHQMISDNLENGLDAIMFLGHEVDIAAETGLGKAQPYAQT